MTNKPDITQPCPNCDHQFEYHFDERVKSFLRGDTEYKWLPIESQQHIKFLYAQCDGKRVSGWRYFQGLFGYTSKFVEDVTVSVPSYHAVYPNGEVSVVRKSMEDWMRHFNVLENGLIVPTPPTKESVEKEIKKCSN